MYVPRGVRYTGYDLTDHIIAVGIHVLMGMNENSGVCHFTEPGKPRLGSAGLIVTGLEYKVTYRKIMNDIVCEMVLY